MPDQSPTTRRLHAIVHGRVQGVGFRMYVQRQASVLGCRGYVRNVPDGRTVEVVAEADEEALQALLGKLRQGPRAARVHDVTVEWLEATGGFAGFSVRD